MVFQPHIFICSQRGPISPNFPLFFSFSCFFFFCLTVVSTADMAKCEEGTFHLCSFPTRCGNPLSLAFSFRRSVRLFLLFPIGDRSVSSGRCEPSKQQPPPPQTKKSFFDCLAFRPSPLDRSTSTPLPHTTPCSSTVDSSEDKIRRRHSPFLQ